MVQVHLAYGESAREMVMVWAGVNRADNSFVSFGVRAGEYTRREAATSWNFTEGNPDGLRFYHRAVLTVACLHSPHARRSIEEAGKALEADGHFVAQGLVPGTKYYYRVYSGTAYSDEYSFTGRAHDVTSTHPCVGASGLTHSRIPYCSQA